MIDAAPVDLASLWAEADEAYIHNEHKRVLQCLEVACREAETLAAENARLERVTILLQRELNATRLQPVKDIVIGLLDQHADACGACDDAELWLGEAETQKLYRARKRRRVALAATPQAAPAPDERETV